MNKRVSTKSLLNEWKYVVEHGLYSDDPEVLEEGWKEKVASLALVAKLALTASNAVALPNSALDQGGNNSDGASIASVSADHNDKKDVTLDDLFGKRKSSSENLETLKVTNFDEMSKQEAEKVLLNFKKEIERKLKFNEMRSVSAKSTELDKMRDDLFKMSSDNSSDELSDVFLGTDLESAKELSEKSGLSDEQYCKIALDNINLINNSWKSMASTGENNDSEKLEQLDENSVKMISVLLCFAPDLSPSNMKVYKSHIDTVLKPFISDLINSGGKISEIKKCQEKAKINLDKITQGVVQRYIDYKSSQK
jgi:hypothetical protein